MSFWHQAPLFRLLLPFVGGIIAGIFISHEMAWHWPVLAGLFTLLVILYGAKWIYVRYRNRHLFGIVLAFTLAFFGYTLTQERIERHDATWFGNHYQHGDWLIALVDQAPVEKARSVKVVIQVQALRKDSVWKRTTGHTLVYLQKDSVAAKVKYGDLLLLNPLLREVQPPGNPNEFNYKRYLGFHQIRNQGYLRGEDWRRLGEGRGYALLRWAHELRSYFLGVFRKHGIEGDEFAVASALILGYKDELDKALVRAYSGAGATHILAVSGLHVGIVFLVLDLLLRFMDKNRYSKLWKAAILVLALWFYATLTGLSPSVLRAATMFSFVVVGKATARSTNIYNTLAASAFLLLIINPILVMEVGFQLSYLAVIGIVFLQPKLYPLIDTNNWLFDKMWAITTVSISAQAATFPLGLLYFHQFPNYFIFSNLLVIPLAAVILYLGMLVFITSFFDPLCYLFAVALKWVIWFLNWSVRLIEQIPYSITEGVSITIAETWAIYMTVIFLLAFSTLIRLAYLRIALVFFIALAAWQGWENYVLERQRKFIVYKVDKEQAYDFVDGRTNYFIASERLFNDVDKMLFHVKHNWWNMDIGRTTHFVPGYSNYRDGNFMLDASFVQFYESRVAVVDSSFYPRKLDKPMKVDILIIANNARVTLAGLSGQFEFGEVIIDSSNSLWRAEKWLSEAAKLGLACHAVPLHGAFVKNI